MHPLSCVWPMADTAYRTIRMQRMLCGMLLYRTVLGTVAVEFMSSVEVINKRNIVYAVYQRQSVQTDTYILYSGSRGVPYGLRSVLSDCVLREGFAY